MMYNVRLLILFLGIAFSLFLIIGLIKPWDHALVGRRTESKKSYCGVRHVSCSFLSGVLRAQIYNSINMKRLILVGVVALFVTATSCSSKSSKATEQIKEAPREKSDLPNITLIEEDGNQFSSATLSGNTILIFFGADCDHCQREAVQIHKNLKAFESYTLYFISMDPFPVIHKFANAYAISNQPNIRFLRADGRSVFSAMGNMSTPTICIFAGNKRLVKRFDGETKIEEILKLL